MTTNHETAGRQPLAQEIFLHSGEELAPVARVMKGELPVLRHIPAADGKEWLYFQITDWDDVAPYVRKVIEFEGRKFVWSCWNSDACYMVFNRPLNEPVKTARVARA